MYKVVLLFLISILGCDIMAISKVNEYTPTDPNPENMQVTIDAQRGGYDQSILLNLDDATAAPEVSASSKIEINGGMYEAPTDTAVSTTDPFTSSTVSDGTVYIILDVTAGATATPSFTATPPVFSYSKNGWYGTGTYANSRYLKFIATKAGANYTEKTDFGKVYPRFVPFIYTKINESITSGGVNTSVAFITSGQIDYLSEVATDTITMAYSGLYKIDINIRCQSTNYSATVVDSSVILKNNGSTNLSTIYNAVPRITGATGGGVGYISSPLTWIGFLSKDDVLTISAQMSDLTTPANAFTVTGEMVIQQIGVK